MTWSDDCSNLVGASKARGKDVVVACVGASGFRKHPNEDPVSDGKLRVATVAVRLGDAFLGGGSESITLWWYRLTQIMRLNATYMLR